MTEEKATKLTDEELDLVAGGNTTETAQVTAVLKQLGWDGEGSIQDAINKVLAYTDEYGNKYSYIYGTSDTEANSAGEKFDGHWPDGRPIHRYQTASHAYIMGKLRDKLK